MVITCPSCKEQIVLSKTEQQDILLQVRDQAFSDAVKEAVSERTQEIKQDMKDRIDVAVKEAVTEERDVARAREQQLQEKLYREKEKNQTLISKVQIAEKEQELAVMQAVNAQKSEDALQISQLTTERDYYKDLKSKMSTKMVGESLEQHCMTVFNQIRMTAFPNAYFEKDNDVSSSGSKGDFIFREEQDGVELLSIMFEMKNQMDTTASKHKNEDFFKELDKDRREKHCEYAILVSLLETDNDFYNTGIVDVSYKYPKMFVVRPQFFLAIIGILRNAAFNSLEARKQLKQYQEQNLDVIRFEEDLSACQTAISRNHELAIKQFDSAIDEIDKAIEKLEKVKKDLLSSERNLRLMNDKVADLSIRKLTKNSPNIRSLFE